MDKEKLKLELIEKIINCDDAAVLKRVEEMLSSNFSKVSEAGEGYIPEKKVPVPEEFNISPEQEEELMRRYRDYLEGKSESYPWEEVRQNLRDLYGF